MPSIGGSTLKGTLGRVYQFFFVIKEVKKVIQATIWVRKDGHVLACAHLGAAIFFMLTYRAFLLVDCGLHIYYLDQGGFELVCFVCLSVGLLKNVV